MTKESTSNPSSFIITLAQLKIKSQIKIFPPSLYEVNLLLFSFKFKLQPKMLSESIVIKISQSIDDLGRLLDQIYKFPNQQRQLYFDQIQNTKNKLITLKSTAKETNLQIVEKHYKHLFLAINKLKNQIYQKLTFNVNKENKDNNRYCLKDIKKNHEHAMKMIIQKDEEIQRLNQAIFEKEQLIQINYEELRLSQREIQILRENQQVAKFQISRIQIQNSTIMNLRNRAEEQALDYRLKDQERETAFREAIEQLQRLRTQLIRASQKIEYYQQLAQISITKTKVVEENIRMVEQQAQYLNDNYRMKQNESMKQIRELQKMQYEIKRKDESLECLSNENNRLKEDLQVMQHEITSLQNEIYQQRLQNNEEKHIMDKNISKQKEENELLKSISHQLTQKLQKSKDIEIEFRSKLSKQEQEKVRLQKQIKEMVFNKENLLLVNLNLQSKNEQYEKQLKNSQQEKQKMTDQLNSITTYYKQLQQDNKSLKQRYRSKEQQKNKSSSDLQRMQTYIKEVQKSMNLNNKAVQMIQEQNLTLKTDIVRLQQKIVQKQGRMSSLEVRLLRAKIQTIHQLRQTLV